MNEQNKELLFNALYTLWQKGLNENLSEKEKEDNRYVFDITVGVVERENLEEEFEKYYFEREEREKKERNKNG